MRARSARLLAAILAGAVAAGDASAAPAVQPITDYWVLVEDGPGCQLLTLKRYSDTYINFPDKRRPPRAYVLAVRSSPDAACGELGDGEVLVDIERYRVVSPREVSVTVRGRDCLLEVNESMTRTDFFFSRGRNAFNRTPCSADWN